jgi:hypothetical protein
MMVEQHGMLQPCIAFYYLRSKLSGEQFLTKQQSGATAIILEPIGTKYCC